MIRVKLYKTSDGFIKKFTVEGHAGYAPLGSDIICSAISALAHTAIGALQELTGYEIYYEIKDNTGFINCVVLNTKTAVSNDEITAGAIMNSFAIGCRQISDSYGKKYVKVIDSSLINE